MVSPSEIAFDSNAVKKVFLKRLLYTKIFITCDLFNRLEPNFLNSISHLLLDPPRNGAESLTKSIIKSNVRRLVYISCNPKTLARDVDILIRGGFCFEKAGVIDMFPHTAHVESIALLTR